MLKWIKSKWQEWNSCKIDNYFGKLDQSMQAVIDKCERIERQLDAEVKLLTEEVALYKGMLHSVAETLPDMMWCKDVDGKYVYANGAIKKGLLFDMNRDGLPMPSAASAKQA
jgi:PAS domain-containing protein